ncbi:MAG: thiamine biosynthesis protein [Candidatus Nitrosotenuis sp.]|nr:MAG: thiamine biosynthesis protein [Candidatus Nitrosotenuis sp.]
MDENAFVVVFPSIFAKNKKTLLINNIKKILKINNQKISQITRDDDLVVIDANDPVFASSAINLLFGVDKIAIARRVENKFDVIVSTIAKIGASLLLRGEQFYIKVEGHSSGYLPKDVEVAATSALIEKTVQMDSKPGSEEKHDKLIYCFLTKRNAYVSIFTDDGHGGIPYNSQGDKAICCVYDEISAISCLESIKQGFDVKIIVCYDDSNLHDLVKMINRILPRTVQDKVTLDFFEIPTKVQNTKSFQVKIKTITHILCSVAKLKKIKRVSLPLSPLAFPLWFIDENVNIISQNDCLPWITLAGIDESIIKTAKEIGLGKHLHKIERFGKIKFEKTSPDSKISDIIAKSMKEKKSVTIKVGPNNIHDILDAIDKH